MKATLTGLLLMCEVSTAATSISASWNVSAVIPDNRTTGWSNTQTLSSDVSSITGVQVHLQTTGGWNGDLYVYLQHGSGFSVLLNRPGRNTENPDGSSASGMNVTFSDSATQSSHSGIFSGSLLPDGRNVSPFLLADQPGQGSAMLSSFNGLDPNGTWTLFVADLSPTYRTTVTGWGLTIDTFSAVPEPGLAAGAGLLLGTTMLRRPTRRTCGSAPATR